MIGAANPLPPDDRSSPDVWEQVIREIEAFTGEVRDLPVLPDIAADDLRAELRRSFTFAGPIALPELVSRVSALLRGGIVHVTSPRYFGLFNPSVLEAGIVADALVALYNPQLAAWSHAPAAIEIERRVLDHFAARLGLPPGATHASFTTGGAEANLSAVLAALASRHPEADVAGVAALARRPRIYLSDESHHSFVKIARSTGLGTGSLRVVPTTERFVMDPAALERRIDEDVRAGFDPLLVVATAGTTSSGAVDPLPEIGRIARARGAWFHVDAAWGGAAVLSPRLRPVLAGIEAADSITWDAHKWLSVPMGAGMFFCRHPEAVRGAFAVSTPYMPPPADGESADPYTTTVQWSRRLIGLKVFMALASLGEPGYASLIEHQTRMGEVLRDALRRAGWVIVNDTPLPVVCFTHPDIRAERLAAAGVLRAVYRRGRVWLSEVGLGGERVLRACITSFRSGEEDLGCLLEELEIARSGAAPALPGGS